MRNGAGYCSKPGFAIDTWQPRQPSPSRRSGPDEPRGRITATCELDLPPLDAKLEIQVPVSMKDPKGVEVARATLRTLIGPVKG